MRKKRNPMTEWPRSVSSILTLGTNTSGGYTCYRIHETQARNLPKTNSLRMFSRDIPWTFYCKMVEIPQKLQENNSQITKLHRQTPHNTHTPLDKIQTFNRLKIISEWILHQFLKIFGEMGGGGGAVLPPGSFLHKKKKENNSSHIIPLYIHL